MDRIGWSSLAVMAYTLLALVRATDAPPASYALILPGLLAILVADRKTRHALERSGAGAELALRARQALRLSVPLVFVTLGGTLTGAWADGRLALAVGVAGAGPIGLSALASARGERGLASEYTAKARTRVALALAISTAAAAVALTAARTLGTVELAIAWDEGAIAVAAMGALAALAATAVLELERRSLELGAADRLRAFVPIAFMLIAIAIALPAFGLLRPLVAFPLALTAGATLAGVASVSERPESLARGAARLSVVGGLTVLPALALAGLAKTRPELGPAAVAAAAIGALIVTSLSQRLADRLAPRTEPWTGAFLAAQRAAANPDPNVALEHALGELRGISSRRNEAPSIYRMDPPSVMFVDVAGYVQREDVSIPDRLAEVAKDEVEGVIQAPVLELAAVRRPEVRPLIGWFEDRSLLALAVIFEHDTAIGMVGLPRGERTLPLVLSEVRALGLLARLLGGHIAVSGKLERSLARERATSAEANQQREALATQTRELALERRRSQALAATLAQRASAVSYSPAARLALEALEKAGRDAASTALIAPAGVDPLPYAAVYHLAHGDAAARRTLFLVDGDDRAMSDLERWRAAPDAALPSPIHEARGGTLVIVDPQLLPRLVQAYVAAAKDDGFRLLAVVPTTVDTLAAAGALDDRLADALSGAAVQIPPLAARSEDLRALALDRLTRLGLRARKKPLGIDRSALAALAEHDWPGNDAELETVLIRAAAVCEGDAIERKDLIASGFRVGGASS